MGRSNTYRDSDEQPLSRRLDQLVQEVGESLQDGFLPASVYGGEDVFEAETERVLHQNWVFIGHESGIPSDGDYCQRYVGRSPLSLPATRTASSYVGRR